MEQRDENIEQTTRVASVSEKIVYIVDDDEDFRDSLVWLLEGAGHSVSAFASGEEFLAAYVASGNESHHKNGVGACLLLDVRMKGMSGLALQQELNQRSIKLPVIMLTGHANVGMAVQAMKNQAVDFIEKPFNDEVLLQLVDQVLKNLDENNAIGDQEKYVTECWQSLSKREKEVAHLVIDGMVNKDIAQQLGISIKTVEIHRSRVMSKMQAKNIAGLIKLVNSTSTTNYGGIIL